MNQIVDLGADEIEQVGGGIIPILALAFTVIATMAAGGYMVGKDMAERENERNARGAR